MSATVSAPVRGSTPARFVRRAAPAEMARLILGRLTREHLAFLAGLAPVAVLGLEPGAWDGAPADLGASSVSIMILSGFIGSRLGSCGRTSLEVLGPGDVLRPRLEPDGGGGIDCVQSWHVYVPTEVALIGGQFSRHMTASPEFGGALLDSLAGRAQRLACQAAINFQPSLQQRLSLTLWRLADRWGRVTPGGVRLPVPLRHQDLAALVAARRPSVTHSLGLLRREGLVAPVPEGWLLVGSPPSPGHDAAPVGGGVW